MNENNAIKLDCAIGGGQVLRTALALSTLLKKPVEFDNIRKNRPNPGLQAQHLTSVKALERMGAETKGASIGSQKMLFSPPERIDFEKISLDVGTAGSVTLVLQTLFLPLAFSQTQKTIQVKGGTQVKWSPSANYFQEVFLPAARRFGAEGFLETEKLGFFPQGGGLVEFKSRPCKGLKAQSFLEKGKLKAIGGVSIASSLPVEIAERQKMEVLKNLASAGFDAKIRVEKTESPSPGTFVFLKAEYENITAGFGALGERKKPAEEVGREAAQKFLEFNSSSEAVDEHLADQIIPLMALAEGKSGIRAKTTDHVLANIAVCEKFLQVKFEFDGSKNEISVIGVKGTGFKPALAQ